MGEDSSEQARRLAALDAAKPEAAAPRPNEGAAARPARPAQPSQAPRQMAAPLANQPAPLVVHAPPPAEGADDLIAAVPMLVHSGSSGLAQAATRRSAAAGPGFEAAQRALRERQRRFRATVAPACLLLGLTLPLLGIAWLLMPDHTVVGQLPTMLPILLCVLGLAFGSIAGHFMLKERAEARADTAGSAGADAQTPPPVR